MDANKILAFIGSKWFVLVLGVLMVFLLPTTYGNLMVVYNAGAMARLWWIPVVFIINLITAILALYKATSMFFGKKVNEQADWEVD